MSKPREQPKRDPVDSSDDETEIEQLQYKVKQRENDRIVNWF
jgi:hypothetical protein